MLGLSIHQTLGQIGIQTQWGSQTMHSPRGDLSIRQPDADVQVESSPGQLTIDSSAAWDALGKGSNLEWSSRIYSQSKGILLQAIAKTVADGKRMGDILNPGNPFAQIARQNAMSDRPSVSYVGPASNLNVKVDYQPMEASVKITPHKAEINYTPHKPEINYNPGDVSVYIRQKNSIDIQVTDYSTSI